jgi:hypothetical protein
MQNRRQSSSSAIAERHLILSQLKSIDNNKSDLNNGLYVLIIRSDSQNITIKWLIELLEKPKRESGGHFILELIPNNETDSKEKDIERDIILRVSASNTELNVSADAIELKQLKSDESVSHVFRVNDFNIDSNDCLTFSEKQRVLLYEIESLHTTERGVLFGYPNVKLYAGQSISENWISLIINLIVFKFICLIVQVCQRENIVTEYFPLHDCSVLDKLKAKWCFTFDKQPIR